MMNNEKLINISKKSNDGRHNKEQMGIYIHIPFCVSKCSYCDFLSAPSDDATKAAYVEALVKEIYATDKSVSVPTIFFGGGTPSILDVSHIQKIMNALSEQFDIEFDAEITVECNPGTVSLSKLIAYKNAGINRLSFGLQSADDRELKTIGRIHTYEQFITSFEMARHAGFDNINVDLISALPDQTVASWENTLRKVINLEPEHISAYSLILEEGTPLYDKIEKERKHGIDRIPYEDSEREMYYLTNELLEKSGYIHYEISNYAKPGYECRHNLSYWAPDNYIGFGIGAASYVSGVRYKNTEDLNNYIEFFKTTSDKFNLSEIQVEVTKLTKKNQMEEFVFLGLRRMDGISTEEFYKRFRIDFETVFGEVAGKFMLDGLLVHKGDRIFLSERGVDICNSVMSEFLLD